MKMVPAPFLSPEDREHALLEPLRLASVKAVKEAMSAEDLIFERTTRLLAALLKAPVAAFCLVEREGQFLRASVGLPFTETSAEEGVFCRTCVAQDDVLVVEDPRADPRFATTPLVTGPPFLRFYAGAPVHAPDGTAIGTLCVVDVEARTLSDEQRKVLLDLRDHVEEALQSRHEANTDALTALPNRRAFDLHLTGVLEDRRPASPDLTVAMIDVDDFKRYNDTYGHHEGDRVLKTVARTLENTVKRFGGLVGRVGGEEFAALAPGVTRGLAQDLGSQLVRAVSDLQIPHLRSSFGVVTVSVGLAVAGVKDAAQSRTTLMVAADEALYESKQLGRSRHTIAAHRELSAANAG